MVFQPAVNTPLGEEIATGSTPFVATGACSFGRPGAGNHRVFLRHRLIDRQRGEYEPKEFCHVAELGLQIFVPYAVVTARNSVCWGFR